MFAIHSGITLICHTLFGVVARVFFVSVWHRNLFIATKMWIYVNLFAIRDYFPVFLRISLRHSLCVTMPRPVISTGIESHTTATAIYIYYIGKVIPAHIQSSTFEERKKNIIEIWNQKTCVRLGQYTVTHWNWFRLKWNDSIMQCDSQVITSKDALSASNKFGAIFRRHRVF